MKIKLYQDDLPTSIKLGLSVAIDTETMGLNPLRDKLCLIQLSSGNGICHLVRINNLRYKPVNLIKILTNNKILKIFHFARFDVTILIQISIFLNIFTITLSSRLLYL